MPLPQPRGPVSTMLVDRLTGPPGPLATAALELASVDTTDATDATGALSDEDLQLSLTICYELHYQGFDGVDERWEWEPSLLGLRSTLEERFERTLMAEVGRTRTTSADTSDVTDVSTSLRRLVAEDDGPSLSSYIQRRVTVEQAREFAVHRSLYQLKEADPHSWGIPRLSGRAKAALVEIQYDEYGGGRAEAMHCTLFAATLRGLGLDDTYGAYLDRVPASTLATTNAISMFGLHRRWRGALVGHLAAFEMTSSLPNRRYAMGMRRLGFGPAVTRFFDEHVEADAVHEQVAAVDLCGSLAAAEPALAGDVLFGAACCLALETRFAAHLLDAWAEGRSSLRPPGGAAPAVVDLRPAAVPA